MHLSRVRGGGVISRHRHPAPVHGFILKGSWRYLERDWLATEGSYIYEPPGDIHILVVDNDYDEMITLFHNTGAVIYCDEAGKLPDTRTSSTGSLPAGTSSRPLDWVPITLRTSSVEEVNRTYLTAEVGQ